MREPVTSEKVRLPRRTRLGVLTELRSPTYCQGYGCSRIDDARQFLRNHDAHERTLLFATAGPRFGGRALQAERSAAGADDQAGKLTHP